MYSVSPFIHEYLRIVYIHGDSLVVASSMSKERGSLRGQLPQATVTRVWVANRHLSIGHPKYFWCTYIHIQTLQGNISLTLHIEPRGISKHTHTHTHRFSLYPQIYHLIERPNNFTTDHFCNIPCTLYSLNN